MSYQVLARRWRPKSFAELVGQHHVVRALANALDNDRVHHAYLFAGTRGVGKTTLARILAKCLNCEIGVSSTPCGQCSACRQIDEGRFVDLVEVDAASRARVDETRELMENVQFSPARGRYKVYLIDEVHMFSNHSFNALLKTLEEPPPHVKFLLATTDPQKIPITVLSRCLQFNLRRLPTNEIAEQLERILRAEGVTAEPSVTCLLATAADGSLRDALSLLDQAIAYGEGVLTSADARAMLGILDKGHARALLTALAEGDAVGLLTHIEHMAAEVPDFTEALNAVLSELQCIAVAQAVPDALAREEQDREAVLALAQKMAPEDVQLFYQIGLMGRRDLPFAPDPRGGFEMILLRMLAFRPVSAGERVAEGGLTMAQRPARTGADGTHRPVPLPISSSRADDGQDWPAIVEALRLEGITRELAVNSVLKRRTGDVVQLHVAPSHAQLAAKRVQEKLQAALSQYYGAAVRLELAVGSLAEDTPAAIEQRRQAERQQAAIRAIESDPNVEALCRTFDARIDRDSIRPLDP